MKKVASDVGGTFTDLVFFDQKTNRIKTAKTLTTVNNPSDGVIKSIDLASFENPLIKYFCHGGTTVINSITERKGSITALLTTKGFRDVLEIGRGNRPDLYNLHTKSPTPFVPRYLRFEIDERIDANGKVIRKLNLKDLDKIIKLLKKNKVESLAIVFINSYLNQIHEKKCQEIIKKRFPSLYLTASFEISRQWREYERTNTSVLNAFVKPKMNKYLNDLSYKLKKKSFNCPFFIMQSNGGTTEFFNAKKHPLTLLESGPAAGVNGTSFIAKLINKKNLIHLDVGGTTAKCSLIENYLPKTTTEYKLEKTRYNAGYPIQIPVIDIVEIGAGGGSIAWFDENNHLNVGPKSAGAHPGPACYSFGGKEPTVTDAYFILGILNKNNFGKGEIKINVALARKAYRKIAKKLNQSIEDAAISVLRIMESNTINALKLITVQRGNDPRDFSLLACGGGGPIHASSLAKELGIKEVIIPFYPGLFSAWGMLVTAPQRDFIISKLDKLNNLKIFDINKNFEDMIREAKKYFKSSVSKIKNLSFNFFLEMRYSGQEHTVTIKYLKAKDNLPQIKNNFHLAHKKNYTFSLDDTEIEMVSYKLVAIMDIGKTKIRKINKFIQGNNISYRKVKFIDHGILKTQILKIYNIKPNKYYKGPLIIEEDTSTILVNPKQKIKIDDYGILRIKI